MAGSQPEVISERKSLQAEAGGLGDWLAPVIVFVALAVMLLTVISILLGPA
jgi:hypothetical protein